jgi:hypothetical protein
MFWEYYLEYLWFYDEGSWVATIASTFRVMAFILILPMIAISLLVRLLHPSLSVRVYSTLFISLQGYHFLPYRSHARYRR